MINQAQDDPQTRAAFQRGLEWLEAQGVVSQHPMRFQECSPFDWQGSAPPLRWWMLTARQGRITYALYITLNREGAYGVIGEMAESGVAA